MNLAEPKQPLTSLSLSPVPLRQRKDVDDSENTTKPAQDWLEGLQVVCSS